MEALVAVGLASNILSFVDFAKSIVSDAKRFYETTSDAKDEYQEAEDYAQRLQRLAAQIAIPKVPHGGDISGEEKELKELGEQCLQIANQLLATTRDVTANSHNDWVQSARRAMKASLSSSQIKSLQTRLNRIHQQLMGKLLQNQLKKTERALNDMAEENRRLSSRRDGDILHLKEQLQDVTNLLEKGQSQKDILLWLSGISEHGVQFSAEQLIFGRLFFHGMNQRHTNVHPEHEKTFSWIFQEDSPVPFIEFLESQSSSLYWVSGKPGSGKSTAMKYISQHSETMRRLEHWANGKRLIVAKFFFWNAGRLSLLKSLEGMLQSILYQIFRAAPVLIPHAFPEEWAAYHSGNIGTLSSSAGSFSIEQLLAAIRMLCDHPSELDVKICIFVDGLDEYDGRPSDVITLIEALNISTNLKACVSSRPWNEFETAFGENQKYRLYMQDLTRSDIRKYVGDTLENDKTFQKLVASEGKDTSMTLVHDIVDAAQGVFLWVVLVVRSLLDGLSNEDKFSDLQRRLRSLPTDLDEFFECILFTVDDFYSSQMSAMCLVTLIAITPLPLMSYWFMDQDSSRYALDLEVQPMELHLVSSRLETMKKRLNACCKGLLEPTYDESNDEELESSNDEPESNEAAGLWRSFFGLNVDFLHRTVRDFFRIPQTRHRLLGKLPEGFNPEIAICRALLAQIKSSSHATRFFNKNAFVKFVWGFFHSAGVMDHETFPVKSEVELMHEIESTLQIQRELVGVNPFIYFGSDLYDDFFTKCFEYNLSWYINKALESKLKPPLQVLSRLLSEATWGAKGEHLGKLDEDWVWSESQLHLIRGLLRAGADPNYISERFESAPWPDFLRTITSKGLINVAPARQAIVFSILEEYTNHGATIQSISRGDFVGPSGYKSALKAKMTPDQFDAFLKLADSKISKNRLARCAKRISGFWKRLS